MNILTDAQVHFVAGGADPAPCPSGGDCPIDNPQSEVSKTIDDIARGVKKLASEVVDVAKTLWNKLK